MSISKASTRQRRPWRKLPQSYPSRRSRWMNFGMQYTSVKTMSAWVMTGPAGNCWWASCNRRVDLKQCWFGLTTSFEQELSLRIGIGPWWSSCLRRHYLRYRRNYVQYQCLQQSAKPSADWYWGDQRDTLGPWGHASARAPPNKLVESRLFTP